MKNSLSPKNISSNQLFCNFFSKCKLCLWSMGTRNPPTQSTSSVAQKLFQSFLCQWREPNPWRDRLRTDALDHLATSTVKMLVSRNFCQKSVKVYFCNYHHSLCKLDFSKLESNIPQCGNFMITLMQNSVKLTYFILYHSVKMTELLQWLFLP